MLPLERHNALSMEHDTAYLFGPFTIYPAKRVLLNGERPLPLGSRAFDLLVHLVSNAGEVMSAKALMDCVWANSVVDPASLRVHISLLRKTLKTAGCGDYVQNVPLRGYCFVAPVTTLNEPVVADDRHVSTAPPPPPSLAPTLVLPRPLPSSSLLLGRETTLVELASKLQKWRCVTLVGPGGIGKTSVALALPPRLSEHYKDGTVFLDLSPVADPAHLPSALATQLGLALDPRDPMHTIGQWLTERQVLLIVDNCEHLIDTVASFVENLLGLCANVQILATSREPLRISGETVVRLPPLAFPPVHGNLDGHAQDCSAVRLFAVRAGQCDDHFVLSKDNLPLVAEICRRLDGIPLGIELAAANTSTFSLEQIAGHLDERLSLLVHGRRTALPRHQTLRATMDWSFRLLASQEQALLARLAIFRGWFSLDAAMAVGLTAPLAIGERAATASEFAECMHGLISKSMLTMDVIDDKVQYRLQESTRAYAREQLIARDQLSETAQRHTTFLIRMFDMPAEQRDSQPATFWIERYSGYLDDLRAALTWSLANDGAPTLAIQLVASSAPLWFARTLLAEFLSYAERAAALHVSGVEAQPVELLRLYEAMGHAIWHVRGDVVRMTAAFTFSGEIAERNGLRSHQLRSVLGQWLGCVTAADYAGSRRLAERFGQLMPTAPPRDLDILHGRMMTLGLHLAGEHHAAVDHGLRVLQHPAVISSTSTNTGIQFDQHVASLAVLARVHWVRGEADTARECARQATDRARELEHAVSTCFAIAFGAGPVAAWCGDFGTMREDARVLVTSASHQSLRLWQNFGNAYELAASIQDGVRPWDAMATAELARYATAGLLKHNLFTFSPRFAFDSALDELAPGPDSWCAPEMMRLRVLRLLQRGEPVAERVQSLLHMLQQSIALAQSQHALSWELRSTSTMAELLHADGRDSEAIDRLAAVLEKLVEGANTADVRSARLQLSRLQQAVRSAPQPRSDAVDCTRIKPSTVRSSCSLRSA